MTRRARATLAVAVVGAAAVLGGCTDDGGDGADAAAEAPDDGDATPPTVATSTTAALDEEGSDLEALLERQRGLTIHLVYEATSSGSEPYTLEVFRRGGRVRQETATETEQGTFRTAGILVDGEATICQQAPDDDWACSVSAADDGTADGIFGTVLDDLRGLDLTATEETVDGTAATCFAYEGDTGPGRVCVDERGVPLLVSTPEATLELTSSDEDVPESAFEPPADPIAAPAED